MIGIGADEDISDLKIEDTHPDWAAKLVRDEGLPTAVRDGTWRAETALLTRDGIEIPVSQVIVAHKGPDGNVEFFATIMRDITDRARADAALIESREMLQLVMNNIPQSVFWKDRDGVYLGCNENFAREAGIVIPDEIAGKTDRDLPWTKEQADSYREWDQRVMESGRPELHIEEKQRQADGTLAWVDTNKVPLRDAENRVVGILGTYEVITERIAAEQALQEARRNTEAS